MFYDRKVLIRFGKTEVPYDKNIRHFGTRDGFLVKKAVQQHHNAM
jgi:hypothetical protein